MLVKNDPPSKFQLCKLTGGPHDGQTVTVPADEDVLTFQHHGRPQTYRRLGIQPDSHHVGRIARLLGGR